MSDVLPDQAPDEGKRVEPAPNPLDIDFDALPPIPEDGRPYAAEWWIASSHLRSKKQEAFVSLVTVLSILGVVAGVAVLNWVIAVMTGFEVDLRDKILGTNAHVVVLAHGGKMDDHVELTPLLEEIEGVEAVAPFVYSEMMIRSPFSTSGVVLKGMDPERTGEVTSVRDDLLYGPRGELTTDEERRAVFASLTEPVPAPLGDESAPLPGILIGRELMDQLQVYPGDIVQVVNPVGTGIGPMGMPVPQIRPFRVAGVFYSGMYEYDTKWTYVNNPDAQKFLKLKGAVTGLEIRVSEIDAVDRIAADIQTVAPYPHYTRHWKNLNEKLFAALALEKWVMGLILSMIVVVAALLIVTTLIMLVITKAREIAILKAMGAARRSILRIFVMEGCVIGLVGTVLGTILGLVGCAVLKEYGYPLETDVYYLSELPVVVEPANVTSIAIGAFLLCFLATLYPAYKAASVDPVEGLRYE
jgi:lipoprotein-releasing system permease protein